MALWGRPGLWVRTALITLGVLGVFTASAVAATTYGVTTTADDSGTGTCSPAPATCTSLRQAINTIDAAPPNPPYVVNVAAGDYVLSNGTLGITESVTINGVIAPIQRPAGILPTAVRAAEGEVVNLSHLTGATASPARCCSSREGRHTRAPVVVQGGARTFTSAM